jgi:hypothetical protein
VLPGWWRLISHLALRVEIRQPDLEIPRIERLSKLALQCSDQS